MDYRKIIEDTIKMLAERMEICDGIIEKAYEDGNTSVKDLYTAERFGMALAYTELKERLSEVDEEEQKALDRMEFESKMREMRERRAETERKNARKKWWAEECRRARAGLKPRSDAEAIAQRFAKGYRLKMEFENAVKRLQANPDPEIEAEYKRLYKKKE